ncbi:Heat-labile enterotoxin, A chain, partial [Metarhizium majus ARSEF 297]
MFAFVAISILLIGIYGQSNNPNSEQQDALFQQYETLVAQVLEQASHGIKCYTDYVPRVEHESPTLSEVFSLDKCHEAHDAHIIYLRDARNTARQHNFTRDQLLDKKLPYVFNTQQGGQDEYTEAYQVKLQQLRDAANSAQKVYRAKRDVVMKATTKAANKLKEESSEHAKEIAGAGIAMRFFALAVVVGAFAAGHSKLDQITPLSIFMSDHGTKQFLLYIDFQSPDITFSDGFKPNRSRHLLDDFETGLVWRTRRDTTAIHHATSNNGSTNEHRYIYVLSLEGSNHTASYGAKMHTGSTETFVPAISGSVKPETIVGAYSFGNLHGGRHVMQEWIANPKYEHINTSPYIAQGTETPTKLEGTSIGEVADIAEKVSQDEFAKLVKKFKLTRVVEKWLMSIPDARKRLLNYKPLGPKSPKLRAGSGGTAGSLAIGAVGAAAWVGGVVAAFIRDASALDRAAAVTSIIPLAGCATGLAAEIDKGEISASARVDSTMCFLGDALILGGLAPIGVAVHLARLLVQTFTPPPKPPTKEEMQSKMPLAIEAIMVISEGAQSIGALNASSRVPDSNSDQELLQSNSQEAAEKIREAISVEIKGRQQRFLLGLPAVLRSNSTALLKTTAEQFNDNFIKKLTSKETIDRYRSYQENPSPGGKLPGNSRQQYLVKLMDDIGQHLRETPLPMPDLVEVAFILGQSKGLTNIDPSVLSPREYMKQQAHTASEDDINRVTIQHAFGILQLIQGKIKQHELPTIFPVQDSQSRQGLQVLLAMQIGKAYEEAKTKKANKFAGGYLPGSDLQVLIHPWTIPLEEHPDAPLLIGLVLGISKDLVEASLAEPSS